MKKLLVTGFEPFGGETINPSWTAVCRLPEKIGPFTVIPLCVPVVYGDAAETVLRAAERIRPDAVVCVGQAGGRRAVTPEKVAVNYRDASIADNAGTLIRAGEVVTGGPDAYFSTLPVEKMVQAICAAGLPGALSLSAGAFVCNDLFYTLRHRLPGMPVGFIHVPYLPEQAGEGVPSLSREDTVRALVAAIGAMGSDAETEPEAGK